MRRVFFTIDHLALEQTAMLGADYLGDGLVDPVERGEIDLVVGSVFARVVSIGAKESVREPLRKLSK
jgi:hypothetical protein